MFNSEVEERLAGVMLLRWQTAVAIGDEQGAVDEASNYVATQLDVSHPLRYAFAKLGFISSEKALAPLNERKNLLRRMLDYTALITKGLPHGQQLLEAPRAFYTAALLLEEGRGDLLDMVIAYKPY